MTEAPAPASLASTLDRDGAARESLGRLRAEKLQMRTFLGVKDKARRFADAQGELGVTAREVAYIGDDVNDLALMEIVGAEGLVGVPGDGMPAVRDRAHYVTRAPGGHGAFREFAEWLLTLRTRAP